MKSSALRVSEPAASEKSAEIAPQPRIIKISRPKFERAVVHIVGTAPYVQHKFSEKARLMMEEKQKQGTRAKSRKTREARNFEADYLAAMHLTAKGLAGIPAPAFRNAMISACRIVDFAMTRAKMSIFVEADHFDKDDGTPLVPIQGNREALASSGPEMLGPLRVRNESGVADLRVRPMWHKGWTASVHLKWDADQFSAEDIFNLMARAGEQVGIGEGRPDSPKSNGLGWGTWEIVE